MARVCTNSLPLRRRFYPNGDRAASGLARFPRSNALHGILKKVRPAGASAAFETPLPDRPDLHPVPIFSPPHKPIRTAMMLITTLVVGGADVGDVTTINLLAVGLGGGIGMLGVSETE